MVTSKRDATVTIVAEESQVLISIGLLDFLLIARPSILAACPIGKPLAPKPTPSARIHQRESPFIPKVEIVFIIGSITIVNGTAPINDEKIPVTHKNTTL